MPPKIYWRDELMLHDNENVDMEISNCLKAIERKKRESARMTLSSAEYEEVDTMFDPVRTSPEMFDKIVRHRIDTCLRVLLEKNEEYSRNGDRLHNFRSAGRVRDRSALEALEGMEVKHTISIDDLVRDCVEDKDISVSRIEEKFTDAINYLLLKEALVREYL
jgi:hypothetical protein